jgi:hypothetical protein
MSGILAALFLSVAAAAPRPGACPARAAIAAEIDGLGALQALAQMGIPEVTVEGASMRIVLRSHEGALLGVREVAAPLSCQGRAAVAAVVIVAWLGEWNQAPPAAATAARSAAMAIDTVPSPAVAPASSAVAPASSAVAPASPAVAPASSTAARVPAAPSAGAVVAQTGAPAPIEPGRDLASSPPATLVESASSEAPPPGRGGGARGDLSAFVAGVHDGDAGTVGFGLQAGYGLGRRITLAVLAEGTGERTSSLGPGQAAYSALSFGAGASLRTVFGRGVADLGLFPEAVRTALRGEGLATARGTSAWGLAVEGRVRLGLRLGGSVPFVQVGASYDLTRQRLTLDDRPSTTTLSPWSLSAGLGILIPLGALGG